MPHYSKFPLFAFLALVCVAVSGCTTTNYLSSDPNTSEDILRASTEHGADITLISGRTIHSCYGIAVRKDSTQWRLAAIGPEVSMPTDSVASIRIATPAVGTGILIGAPVGALLGVVIGAAVAPHPPPPSPPGFLSGLSISDASMSDALDPFFGGLIGLAVGGIAGGIIGSTNGTVWTNANGTLKWDAVHVRWINLPNRSGKDTLMWDYANSRWVSQPSDTIQTRDTTQTKLPH